MDGHQPHLAVRNEDFISTDYIVPFQVADLYVRSLVLEKVEDELAHGPGHAATIEGRCRDRIVPDNKHVAHGTADEPSVSVECEAFEGSGRQALRSRKYLFDSVKRLEACNG